MNLGDTSRTDWVSKVHTDLQYKDCKKIMDKRLVWFIEKQHDDFGLNEETDKLSEWIQPMRNEDAP